jgi:hypothetical protein
MENNTTQALAVYDDAGQLPIGTILPPDATTSQIEALSDLESRMLENYETIIEQGEQTLIEVGQALAAINKARLYRAEYTSFEEYCREKWNFGRKRGYELMRAGEMAQELSASGLHLESTTERHLRAVAKLKNTKQRVEAFNRARELAGKKKVTSRNIEEAVNEILGIPKPVVVDVEVVNEPPPAQTSFTPIVHTGLADKETNEQAVNRLLSSLREHADHYEWSPLFNNMLDELEAVFGRMLRERNLSAAAA